MAFSDESPETPHHLLGRVGVGKATLVQTQQRLADGANNLDFAIEEFMERRYTRRGPAYFAPVALRLRAVDLGRLAEQLAESGQLTDAERDAILDADILFSGWRREDQAEVYLLVEVSAGVGLSDVRRAVERARALEKLGRPVLPVVPGTRPTM